MEKPEKVIASAQKRMVMRFIYIVFPYYRNIVPVNNPPFQAKKGTLLEY
jgi:hypothetical protein